MKNKKDNTFKCIIVRKIIIKTMISLMLFLLFLIGIKKIDNFKEIIYDKVYNSNISFAKINYWYESHFGSIIPIKKVDDVLVFNESLVYDSKEEYLDGVLLKVKSNYLVPSIKDGIVIFIGEKDGYGNTVIVEDEEGIDIWYSNINIGNINMYDYINKGDYLGEVIDNKLIMVFQKKGKFIDYNKYI